MNNGRRGKTYRRLIIEEWTAAIAVAVTVWIVVYSML